MAFDRAKSPRVKKVREPLGVAGLLDYALKSLGSKMKSERDMRHRMRDRAEPGEEGQAAIDAVVLKLKEYGYLSDERFAVAYTRMRQENEKFGKRRVQQGLMQKGIPTELANSTLTAAYEDVDEVALARQYVERKRMKKPEGDKEIARAMRRLVGAGFTVGTVWKVLKAWGAEVEETEFEGIDDGG
jgi:regulatory protein